MASAQVEWRKRLRETDPERYKALRAKDRKLCAASRKESDTKRRQRDDVKAQQNDASKKWRAEFKARDPEGFAAYRREESRKRYLKHRERLLAEIKAYRNDNPEKAKVMRDAWRAKNWERLRKVHLTYWHKRRAIQSSAEGLFTREEWLAICEKQRDRCFDCGEERKLTIGHLVPLSKGGSNWPDNIVGQCQRCNSKQGSQLHPSVKERGK